jgi:replicative DNA helicase
MKRLGAAHVVLLIHAPIENDELRGKQEIIIGKNRHGPIGSVPVSFDSRTLTFVPRKTLF